MPFTLFSKLPSELRDEVLRNCATGDQLAYGEPHVAVENALLTLIARTCKSAHEESIPIIYSHVDISLHNDSGLFPDAHFSQVLADSPHRFDFETQEKCDERQQMFFDAIKRHPNYGRYVFKLVWTFISHWEAEDEERQTTEAPMWETFKILHNVRHLDFGSLACIRERIAPPSLLFPRVTHLRLSGQMTFALVRAFIDALDPRQLISLECDNLQDFGQDQDGQDLDRSSDLSCLLESRDSLGNGIRHPGVMRGHLQRLEGKCSNLCHLSLRSVGQDNERDCKWSPALDIARYGEWASFIQSVQSTLETLVIEQGLEIENTNIYTCRTPPSQIGKPMDDRLVKYLLPTLCNGNWLRLKQLKVLGIGCDARYEIRGYQPGAATALYVKNALVKSSTLRDVKVEVREEATKTFFFRKMGPTYDS